MSAITVSELQPQLSIQPGPSLIDVRTPAEFDEVHATGAVNLPLDRLTPEAVRRAVSGNGDQPFYILCRSGARADVASNKLESAGLNGGVVVTGGTLAWIEAGLPVVRGTRKTISLERQVRIAAGTLVLTGAILGWLVHPGFFGLSAFIGAGLIFAGVTDWCGMGLLLGKAPWNQSRAA